MGDTKIGLEPRYSDVIQNAYWVRASLNSRLRPDEYDIKDYKAHLHDCKKNPTIGFLARKRYIKGRPMEYPLAAKRNLRDINKQPEIDILQKSIDEKIQTLYPRTKHIRQYIIDNKRVALDGIEEIRKYTIFDKMAIFLKRFI
jgi:hypothetical protein